MDPGMADMTDVSHRPFDNSLQALLAGQNLLSSSRFLVAIAALVCVLVTLEPFRDLRNAANAGVPDGRMAVTYLCFGALAAIAVLLSASENILALKTLWTPLHLCLVLWMTVNIVFSENPGVSLQRFALTASVTSLAIMMPLLLPTQRAFNQCLGISAMILLALCYLGIILAPQLSIHGAGDFGEPSLAGDWRGTFAHKNVAAPVMTMLVYLGLYLTVSGGILAGPTILVLAGVFLAFTGGKTSSALCLVMLALASLISATRSLWLKRMFCFAPLVALNLLTVGSVASERLASLTKLLPVDSTFTGRTDIWEFALAAVGEKPITGHGFAAFWDSDDVIGRQTNFGAEWAVTAAHSHNSYLDLAVTIGLPGLVLVIIVLALSPLKNFHAIQAGGRNGALPNFLLTIWLFGLYYGTTETFLLDRQNPTWFMFALAVGGLHFLARFPVRR
jgi:O-antigen ligase